MVMPKESENLWSEKFDLRMACSSPQATHMMAFPAAKITGNTMKPKTRLLRIVPNTPKAIVATQVAAEAIHMTTGCL